MAGVDQLVRSTDCDSVGCGFESRLLPPALRNGKDLHVSVIEALLDLQDVDSRIMEYEAELKELPARKAQENAQLNGASEDLKAAKASLLQFEQRVKEYEETAKTLKEKRDDLKRGLLSLKSQKEYSQFSIQIDQVEHDIETAESNIVASTDELPGAQDRVNRAQAAYDLKKGEIEACCAEFDERIASVQADLDAANAERLEKAKVVDDPQFMFYYERLRSRGALGWPAVVALTSDGVCDGCHLQQPPSVSQLVVQNAKNAAKGGKMRIIACNMCGRMLYR